MLPTPQAAELRSCCAASYSHPAVRWLLGESFHPGGLALTSRLAKLVGVEPRSRVLDAGSGRGASAVHLAKTLGCEVVGVTLEADGVAAGLELAEREIVTDRVTFVEGDIQEVELEPGSFDVVLMECVLSILPDKVAALGRMQDLLQPGARIGLSDVTVSGPLPAELQGVVAAAACVGDARPLAEYCALTEAAGFAIEHSQDLPETAASFLKDIKGKLLLAEVAAKLGKLPVDPELIDTAKRLLAVAQDAVRESILGYGLIVARR